MVLGNCSQTLNKGVLKYFCHDMLNLGS